MAPKASCLLCGSKFADSGMTRHLQSCLQKEINNTKNQKIYSFFHILVSAKYAPEYWLHLKVKSDSRLETLDQFLRDIWLECCGHLSTFGYGRDDLPMELRLKDAISPGKELSYDYDFGSTTSLIIKAIAEYQGPIQKNKSIQILARNEAPEYLCDECGKALAVHICVECQWEDAGWLCQSCADNHECGEDMFLPVVNSPRTGVCGYTGD